MEEQEAKLLVDQDEEEDMAVIPCAECGIEHVFHNRFDVAAAGSPSAQHSDDIIRGTLLPGRLLRQDLHIRAQPNAKEMIEEALKCFYGGSYPGVVAMCRSAITEELLGKGVGNRNDSVPDLVRKAKEVGLVETPDEAHAETTRLIARGTLHHMEKVNEDDAVLTIRGAVIFINNVAGRQPKPA